MTDQATAPASGETQASGKQIQFSPIRIFVKDISFEAPQGATAFQQQYQPKINQDLNTQVSKFDDKHYEVVLKLTITANTQQDKTLFLAEVHQAGIFAVSGVEGMQLRHLLTAGCPQILFPYAREAVDNLATRGGFPPLALPPINFDALFAQQMAKEKADAEASAEPN
ncbi:MAG: protein-export chaperone SecB [Cellvibrionaceae bacterium]|nr:protein-export chaperone SecB [Cellvibrionaceae bacterium]